MFLIVPKPTCYISILERFSEGLGAPKTLGLVFASGEETEEPILAGLELVNDEPLLGEEIIPLNAPIPL